MRFCAAVLQIQELAHHRRALAQQQVFLRQQLHERVWAAARMLHAMHDNDADEAAPAASAGCWETAQAQSLPAFGCAAAGAAGLGEREVVIEEADLMAAQDAALVASTSSFDILSNSNSSSSHITGSICQQGDFPGAGTSISPQGTGSVAAGAPARAKNTGTSEGAAAAMTREELLAAVGAVDDWVRYMGFQAAWVKVMNKLTAAARVTLKKGCQQRADRLAWIK